MKYPVAVNTEVQTCCVEYLVTFHHNKKDKRLLTEGSQIDSQTTLLVNYHSFITLQKTAEPLF